MVRAASYQEPPPNTHTHTHAAAFEPVHLSVVGQTEGRRTWQHEKALLGNEARLNFTQAAYLTCSNKCARHFRLLIVDFGRFRR